MATVAAIKAFAKKHGASFDADGDVKRSASLGHALYLDAPSGKVWRENGCHVSCALHGNGAHGALTGADLDKTLVDVKTIIDLGADDCDDDNCDVCHPADGMESV
jgi:hypothetical protein